MWPRRWASPARRRASGCDGSGRKDAGAAGPQQPTAAQSAAVSDQLERTILACRRDSRVGAVSIAWELRLNPSTVGRVLRRHQVPRLSWCDRTTGVLLRGQRSSAERYEYDMAGGLVHIGVKKPGKIPDGGGWRVHGRSEKVRGRAQKHGKLGYDFVHSAVDDHSRLAYSEIHDDERAETCAAFLARALAFSYRHSIVWKQLLTDRGVRHIFIKPHCPWTNGKVGRFNRTMQPVWAYRRPWTSNEQRRQGLARWLQHYNNRRPHTALQGRPPISRVSTT